MINIKNISNIIFYWGILILVITPTYLSAQYYVVDLAETGTTQLTILIDSISNLESGDEIGIFDENAITNYNDCSNQINELLVGSGVWDGTQLNIVSVGSNDLCSFGGAQFAGYVEGNSVVVKVWRESLQMEYTTELAWGTGTGNFGDIIQSISEITLLDPNACDDDDAAVAAFGGCAGAVAALGCDFVFGGVPISESCPVSCDACPDEPILGCMDLIACNFNTNATENDGSCEYSEDNYDCDGNCTAELDCNDICGGTSTEDMCDTCDNDATNDCIQDCNGVWGGFAYEVTLCEDTDGDGLGNPGSETTECVEGGRDVADGCDLPVDNILLNSDGSVVYNASSNIGGFQFNVDGATINSASGGDAGSAGFMTSASGNMVLGFSMSGATFGPCGTLINLDLSGEATGLSGFVISDATGGSIDFTYYIESGADLVADCTDIYPYCGANEFDCMGECGGPAEELGCGCNEPATLSYWNDSDGDGLGAGESVNYCLADLPDGWVENNDDTEPDCATNDTDNCDVCAGGNANMDCNGDCFGEAFVDDCGVCSEGDTGFDANADDVGCGCFEPVALSYWDDSDGDGLGAGESINYCFADLPDGWVGNNDDTEPDCATNDTDDCGVCAGDGFSCIGDVPELFQFEQSTLQAFYFFNSVLDLQGNPIESTDWVAAFNGDICVGARQWNLDDCGGLCDVPVMGDDGESWSSGYMVNGDIPTFKIYDSSEDMYYDAVPSQSNPWSNFGFLMADELNVAILGCTDESAENYNVDATVDDGSCDFGFPILFQFEQSTLQAFYFTYEAYDIFGETLAANDWIGAFNGDVCVGARKWDLSLCQGGVCDIPVMGNDGSEQTQGYMQQGGIPSFKIYDASEDSYFAAIPSQNYTWSNFNMQFIDEIVATEIDYLSIPLHKDNNLISFYILPSETSLISVMDDIQSSVLGVIGEAISSQYMVDEGGWVGSLTQFNTYSGYWLYMGDSVDTLDIEGVGIDPNKQYDLHEGLNLISFPVPGSVGISEGIPDDIEDLVPYIISEAVATAQINGEWVGSLDSFDGAHGYWFNVDEPMTFQYNLETLDALSRQKSVYSSKADNPFKFSQSEIQSFYFIDVGEIEEARFGDWVLAYHNELLVGSRQWMGKHIDVPVMGHDGRWNTIGYPQIGDEIEFKLYSEILETEFSLSVGINQYIPNQVQIVESVSIVEANIPTDYYLSAAYPNPFNPETRVKMYIPQESNINVVVYDINGRHVETLLNGNYEAGEYDISWKASEFPSGIYFITLSMENEVHTAKAVLMK